MTEQIEQGSYWKKCNICKKEIAFGSTYYLCSVSTCRSKRTGLTFCSLECWDAHLGFVHHRTSYAEEKTAPSKGEYLSGLNNEKHKKTIEQAKRRIDMDSNNTSDIPTLVVVSKVKQFIRDHDGMKTSQCAIDALSEKVAKACLEGIERAKEDGRKTVKGRDLA